MTDFHCQAVNVWPIPDLALAADRAIQWTSQSRRRTTARIPTGVAAVESSSTLSYYSTKCADASIRRARGLNLSALGFFYLEEFEGRNREIAHPSGSASRHSRAADLRRETSIRISPSSRRGIRESLGDQNSRSRGSSPLSSAPGRASLARARFRLGSLSYIASAAAASAEVWLSPFCTRSTR